MPKRSRSTNALYIRNIIFGGEDSLVSTVGLLSGIAAAGVGKQYIVLTGVVLIFVEALSMSVGSFLSESSAEEYLQKSEINSQKALVGALLMFGSYFVLGFIPLFPYILFSLQTAFWASIAISVISLFLIGLISGKESRISVIRSALKMSILGGSAIAVGILVGGIVN